MPALGLEGAGVATSSTRAFLMIGLLAWILMHRLHEQAWVPWSRESLNLSGLGEIVWLGLPIALQYGLEGWAFQISGLMAGWLGLLNLLLGCLWLTLLIAPIAVSIADLQQLMPVLLQIGFLSSPILFFRQSLGSLSWIANLNPLYAWVRLARDPFLGDPHWGIQGLVLIGQLLIVIGLLTRLETKRMRIIRWL